MPLYRTHAPWCLLLLGLLAWHLAASPATTRANPEAPPLQSDPFDRLSAGRMLEDIATLSSPTFNGRQTGTVDDQRSAVWMAERFRSLGLHPGAPNPLQASVQQPWMMQAPAPVHTLSSAVTLAFTAATTVVPLEKGTDYLPVLDSPSAALDSPVAFVGYGLSDPARDFDEYRDIDVTGRIVVFLRGKPPWYEGSISHHDKVRLAREHGAVGYLTVTGPILTPYEARRGIGTAPLAYYGHPPHDAGQSVTLPGAWVSVAAADRLLADGTVPSSDLLATLQTAINRDRRMHSRLSRAGVRLQWEHELSRGTLHNVVAILEGSDPGLREETILIGAHRDHFGRQAGLLFPGADDNASGTAVLLEVARSLMTAEQKPKRSILLVSFSGEEQGLLGSTAYVAHPARPLGKTVAMINVDHAGIGNGRLIVGVTGMERSLVREAGTAAGLADQLDVFGFFPGGDHVPFKDTGVPTVTVVSGGPHPHFHQASDTVDTLRSEVLLAAARFVLALTIQLAQ